MSRPVKPLWNDAAVPPPVTGAGDLFTAPASTPASTPAPAPTTTLAPLPLPPCLMALLAPAPIAAVPPPSRPPIGPYVHVFTSKGDAGGSKRNGEIAAAFGGRPPAEGTPVLWSGGADGTWKPIDPRAVWVILAETWHWTLYVGAGKGETSLAKDQPRGMPAGCCNKWNEAVTCLLVFLAPELIATISTFRGSTRTQCVRDYHAAVAASTEPAFLTANAVVVGNVPNPRLRVVGTFSPRSDTGKRSGNRFTVIDAVTRAVNLFSAPGGGELAGLTQLTQAGPDGADSPLAAAQTLYNEGVKTLGSWKE